MIVFLEHWIAGTWAMITESAPWLLFGFFFAGVIQVMLPRGIIEKQLSEKGLKSVLKATLYGIPLPLCSCSVIPVGATLRRNGASRGATASFFVSTPEIGADSFLLSYVLLGPFLAVVRIVAVIFSSLGVGLVIDKFTQFESTTDISSVSKSHCCSKNRNPEKPSPLELRHHGFASKIKRMFHFSFVEIFDDLVIVLTIGLLGAGFVSAIIPDNFFHQLDISPLISMILLLAASLPLYVCATSSTPLVAALLAKGLSPGAALVFLLAGPATNFSTMLVIRKELGSKSLFIYIGTISVFSLFFAYLTNLWYASPDNILAVSLQQKLEHHSHATNLFGFALVGLLLLSLIRRYRK